MNFDNKNKIHFIGIGGVSMSALARFSMQQGFAVSGSDAHFSSKMTELGTLGALVYEGEKPHQIDKVDVVVYSSAIKPLNSELMRAYSLGKKVYERHEYLGEVAKTFDVVVGIAGTHGKTTVTAMVAHVLKKLEANFVANIGGEAIGIGNYFSNSGEGERIFVAEACEYKHSLLSLTPTIGVVTNIECDHPDCYATLDSVQEVFAKFLLNSQTKILNLNDFINLSKKDKRIAVQFDKLKISDKCTNLHVDNCTDEHMCNCDNPFANSPTRKFHNILTNENMYTCEAIENCLEIRFEDTSELKIERNRTSSTGNNINMTSQTNKNEVFQNIQNECNGKIGQVFDLYIDGIKKTTVKLPLLGDYNRQNAIYAIATVCTLGFAIDEICEALSTFRGVSRRFECVGKYAGAGVIFDFAHHPTELKCVMEVAKGFGKVLAVFQPHTYTRTAKYIDDFVSVFANEKELILMPTYGARELPEDGIETNALAKKICEKSADIHVYTPDSHGLTLDLVANLAPSYDLILFLGAGDIYDLKKIIITN